MDLATYRKNVIKTVDVRAIKAGLRSVLRKSNRVIVLNDSAGLASTTGQLMLTLNRAILGHGLTEEVRIASFENCGDISHHLVSLAKVVKAKLPGAGKKLKLKEGTRYELLFELQALALSIQSAANVILDGPPTKVVKVMRPSKDNPDTPQEVEAQAVDTEATDAQLKSAEETIAALIVEFAPKFWTFVYDTYGVPPANVFVGHIASLSHNYAPGFFTIDEVVEEDDQDGEQVEEAAPASQAAVA